MANYTQTQAANKQAKLLDKLKELPATKETEVILDLLAIQIDMAHILADTINNKGGKAQ